ncbi:hypothetical protein BH09MYX1_BH09MYX1_41280 [soil metagenome]
MSYRLALAIALSAVVVLPACKKDNPTDPPKPAASTTTTTATTATTPVAAQKPFEATFEGKPLKFTATINTASQNDGLSLTTGAPGCSGEYKEGDTTLSIDIPLGPGGKHFSPGPFAVSALLTNEKDKFATSFVDGVINIEPGEWKVGNKIKGTLRIDDAEKKDDKTFTYAGSGSFEAEICGMADPADLAYQATPVEFEKTPATGSFGGGDKFVFKSGIAELSHNDARNIDEVSYFHLFDTEVTCDNWRTGKDKGVRVELLSHHGVSGKDLLTGTPQTTASYYYPHGKQTQISGPQFVKFDTIELKDGGKISGSLYLETASYLVKRDPKTAGKISGAFTATVCKN